MAASGAEPPVWVWAVWLVVAVVVAIAAMLRPKRKTADISTPVEAEPTPTGIVLSPKNRLQRVPLLAVTGLLSFCAFVGVQLVFVAIHQPTDTSVKVRWSAKEAAILSFASAAVGWAVGFGLLVYGGGVRTVGYAIRRLPSGLLAGAIGIFVALPIVFFSLQATLFVLEKFHVEHPAKHELLEAMEEAPTVLIRLVAMTAAVLAAPLFEEMLFRGCVQGGLRRATGSPWLSIGITSVMFTLVHPAWTMPPIFVFSILLGVVYNRTGNLWATTTMHALFNAFAIFNSGMN